MGQAAEPSGAEPVMDSLAPRQAQAQAVHPYGASNHKTIEVVIPVKLRGLGWQQHQLKRDSILQVCPLQNCRAPHGNRFNFWNK